MQALAAVVTAATLVSVAAPAQAAGKVAALVPQIRPNSSPELQNRFHEAITRGLAGPDAEVIPVGEVRLRLGVSDEMLNCAGPGICAARAATALRTDRVVASEVTNFGKDYTIRVVLLDAAGREVTRTEEPCEICTLKEADDAAQRAAARLMLASRGGPAATPAAPPPRSEPAPPPPKAEPTPPAQKQTPAAEPVPPGATATQPRPGDKKPFPWRWVAVGSLVLGVIGVAVGAPLIAIDGNPTCDLPDPKHSCKEVYDTAGGGAALLTLGVAGLAASGVLFYVDYRTRHRAAAQVTVAPTPGGAMLTAAMRF